MDKTHFERASSCKVAYHRKNPPVQYSKRLPQYSIIQQETDYCTIIYCMAVGVLLNCMTISASAQKQFICIKLNILTCIWKGKNVFLFFLFTRLVHLKMKEITIGRQIGMRFIILAFNNFPLNLKVTISACVWSCIFLCESKTY